jgi:hypothetical protein
MEPLEAELPLLSVRELLARVVLEPLEVEGLSLSREPQAVMPPQHRGRAMLSVEQVEDLHLQVV